jgi:hypothetical protein
MKYHDEGILAGHLGKEIKTFYNKQLKKNFVILAVKRCTSILKGPNFV